ncbi:MAG: hypothetical protein QOJ86_5044 [Bradyrhizobium sp.]|jgi:hypothetical protein|nr:hypothetical protein [Bradyrhizobium sp.]
MPFFDEVRVQVAMRAWHSYKFALFTSLFASPQFVVAVSILASLRSR